jgi:EAL domain-containing protein (putative c-di-GMP-specific phosphodiesterase class I)
MDDFGTGYSSLSYLRRFPFDTIKIDRSFIRDLNGEDPSSRIIMHAVSRMGASLGIATLAEGIETEEQLEIARQEGCIEGQGYLFGRPESAAQFSERLRGSALGGGLKKVVSAEAEHSGHRRRATTHLGIADRE